MTLRLENIRWACDEAVGLGWTMRAIRCSGFWLTLLHLTLCHFDAEWLHRIFEDVCAIILLLSSLRENHHFHASFNLFSPPPVAAATAVPVRHIQTTPYFFFFSSIQSH